MGDASEIGLLNRRLAQTNSNSRSVVSSSKSSIQFPNSYILNGAELISLVDVKPMLERNFQHMTLLAQRVDRKISLQRKEIPIPFPRRFRVQLPISVVIYPFLMLYQVYIIYSSYSVSILLHSFFFALLVEQLYQSNFPQRASYIHFFPQRPMYYNLRSRNT